VACSVSGRFQSNTHRPGIEEARSNPKVPSSRLDFASSSEEGRVSLNWTCPVCESELD
jgi:hypothetical protein